jgi:hypothetical protein
MPRLPWVVLIAAGLARAAAITALGWQGHVGPRDRVRCVRRPKAASRCALATSVRRRTRCGWPAARSCAMELPVDTPITGTGLVNLRAMTSA